MKLLFAAALLGFLPAASPALLRPRPVVASPTRHAPAAPDSTTVRLLYGSENTELTELMGRVLHVEKQRLELHDRRLAGRRLHLTLQEYQRGVPGPEQEFTQRKSLTQLDSAGRLQVTIYARQATEHKVENLFILPRATVPKTFAVSPGQVGDYSLRFDIHPLHPSPNQADASPRNPATEFRLPIGPTTVLAVYTLPYEHEGMYLYCGLAQSRVPVGEWYARFKVPHFVVYRVRVE
jgi:hypothetical protein